MTNRKKRHPAFCFSFCHSEEVEESLGQNPLTFVFSRTRRGYTRSSGSGRRGDLVSAARRNKFQIRKARCRGGSQPQTVTSYFSIRETCPAASCQRPSRLISVSVNCTIRSNGLPPLFLSRAFFREQPRRHYRTAALTCRSSQIRRNELSCSVAR